MVAGEGFWQGDPIERLEKAHSGFIPQVSASYHCFLHRRVWIYCFIKSIEWYFLFEINNIYLKFKFKILYRSDIVNSHGF